MSEPADLGSGRALCPDDACVGVLDPAGNCPLCGASGTPAGYDDRELCGDGSCIGVIGDDGRCKECGKPSRSAHLDPRKRGRVTEPPAPETEEPVDLDERRLCPDGACIGVIGADDHCKVCGLAADADAP